LREERNSRRREENTACPDKGLGLETTLEKNLGRNV
jgi:hypothetical protein